MPAKKSKKKKFEKDTNIEAGVSTLQETDHRTPIRGRAGVPPDAWQDQGVGGEAKSDLPYGRPTDDLHPDAIKVRGEKEPYAPDKAEVEAMKRDVKRRKK